MVIYWILVSAGPASGHFVKSVSGQVFRQDYVDSAKLQSVCVDFLQLKVMKLVEKKWSWSRLQPYLKCKIRPNAPMTGF